MNIIAEKDVVINLHAKVGFAPLELAVAIEVYERAAGFDPERFSRLNIQISS